MSDKVVNMVMLGPSRVGKSSLLATMYREIDKMKAGFVLIPEDVTHDRLDKAYFDLSRVIEQPVFTPIDGGIAPSMTFIEHRFEVTFEGMKEFDLVFHDFRGGAMMNAGPELDELREKVAQSHVIFNVLDAAVLINVDAIEGDKLNGHDRVCTLLKQTLWGSDKYLIVFVLVKCEAYIKTESGRKRLIERFEERHQAVLQLIDKLNVTSKNVTAVLIPAITLGCVEFKEIQDGHFVFERNHKEFEPREVDQPLRYALSFALNHVNENRAWWNRMIDIFTGRRKPFIQALKNFFSQRNNTYKKYGNEDLLKVN